MTTDIGRYPLKIYGHKAAMLDEIMSLIPRDTGTFCDLFGGTGVVAWTVKKRLGASIVINDIRRAAHLQHKVLVANNGTILSHDDLALLCKPNPNRRADFRRIYGKVFGLRNADFLDTYASNIPLLSNPLKRDIAIFLPVVCTLQRRKYSSFGFSRMGTLTGNNQQHCDMDMHRGCIDFATKILPSLLVNNGKTNFAFNEDAVGIAGKITADVIYSDSPYVCGGGQYERSLAFLDDMVQLLSGNTVQTPYDGNPELSKYNDFMRRDSALLGFWAIFKGAKNVPLVILSYNTTSGIHIPEIENIAKGYGRDVETHYIPRPRPSTRKGGNRETKEVLIVCRQRASQGAINEVYDLQEPAQAEVTPKTTLLPIIRSSPDKVTKTTAKNRAFDTRSSKTTDVWLTPQYITSALGRFDLDPCFPTNPPANWNTAKNHYTEIDDGLSKEWVGRVWMNPPYGNKTKLWLERLSQHSNGIALIFARTDTKFFHEWVLNKADAVFFLKGRISFLREDGMERGKSTAPSCLVAYGENNVDALRNSGLKGKFVALKQELRLRVEDPEEKGGNDQQDDSSASVREAA